MSTFDSGFSHRFPGKQQLVEELIDGERLLIDIDKCVLTDEQAAVTLPYERVGNYVYYTLPKDSRDLRSVVRLIRKPNVAKQIGTLLGTKLGAVNESFGGIPEESLLDRFTVYSDSNPQSVKKFGGVDMSLLPPFNDLKGRKGDIVDILSADIAHLAIPTDEFGVNFQKAVIEGLDHVG